MPTVFIFQPSFPPSIVLKPRNVLNTAKTGCFIEVIHFTVFRINCLDKKGLMFCSLNPKGWAL